MVAGVDCSTQATKVLIVDVEDGRVVASGRAPDCQSCRRALDRAAGAQHNALLSGLTMLRY